ncbi:FAD-dependent oxidoreductase [Methanobacterium alcaliphilum]|uniref:FAD-dependent oxidoreductase n=1 Tax=Methanobacterium alcaliphilum TaxID=392018 RepID=UPI00200A167E|nr:GMC family oxidoreductase [Methanobacterium alcaliphilum]MCK9150707.1 GMC family oxidoreductase [Methanobacterium alcaliphilum]
MSDNILVIGSGAGGATVARELSKKGKKVTLVEKGNFHPKGSAAKNLKSKLAIQEIDTIKEEKLKKNELYKYLIKNLTDDNVHRLNLELMYLEGVGGTTTVSMANACYACSSCYADSTTTQFQRHDLELYDEFLEASQEMNVNPLPFEYRGPITQKITDAGEKLGFFMEAMPKFIDFSICDKCGNCLFYCKTNAKWDSTFYINEAQKNGAELITDFNIKRVLHNQKRVTGVEGVFNGNKKIIKADKVILSAGALNTPIILRNSGIKKGVGENIFCDLFITVGAFLKDSNFNQEIPMGVKTEFGPYFISPHFSAYLPPLIEQKYKEQGKTVEVSSKDVVGFMIKIADESNGYIDKKGQIFKDISSQDLKLFEEGIKKASDILIEIGADPNSIVISPVRGAHPGGSAAMGRVVDESLQTEIEGLYIADASVIPRAPGRPPILTIVGLAKKLAKIIVQKS